MRRRWRWQWGTEALKVAGAIWFVVGIITFFAAAGLNHIGHGAGKHVDWSFATSPVPWALVAWLGPFVLFAVGALLCLAIAALRDAGPPLRREWESASDLREVHRDGAR